MYSECRARIIDSLVAAPALTGAAGPRPLSSTARVASVARDGQRRGREGVRGTIEARGTSYVIKLSRIMTQIYSFMNLFQIIM